MIIVTGAGRSGTSMIAAIYSAAGVKVGGSWDETVRAGLEDPEAVAINRVLASSLGVSLLGDRRPVKPLGEAAPRLKRATDLMVSEDFRRRAKAYYRARPWNRAPFKGIRWSAVPRLVSEYAPTLKAYSQRTVVVKDPQFTVTLPVWAQSVSDIDAVVLMHRDVREMIVSRKTAGHAVPAQDERSRNMFTYALGNVLETCMANNIPVVSLRFPDILEDLPTLAGKLPLPSGIDRQTILAAVRETVR